LQLEQLPVETNRELNQERWKNVENKMENIQKYLLYHRGIKIIKKKDEISGCVRAD